MKLKSIFIALTFSLFLSYFFPVYAQPEKKRREAVFFEEGQALQKKLNWEESNKKFRRVINEYPTSEYAQKSRIEIGKFYKYNRDWEKAIEEYHQAIAVAPKSRPADDAKTAEAAIHYFRQDFSKARRIFQEVLSETKDWDQIKYCSHWIKELNRKMSFQVKDTFSCGPEALKIAFRIRGLGLTDEEISSLFSEGKNEVSLSELSQFVSNKGLKPKAVKVDTAGVQNLDTPFIALIAPEHYVVVTGTENAKVEYIDPANQKEKQVKSLRDFSHDFTGYALVLFDDIQLAGKYEVLDEKELNSVKGGVCWCCPVSRLGGPSENKNVEFDGTPVSCPGMPSWMVNMVNLNLVVQDIDFRYTSRGMPIEFIRTYNTDDPRDGVFGRSWTFNYNITLNENPDKSIDIRRGDGKIDHFFWNGTKYQGPDGVYDTLTKNADKTYTLTKKDDKSVQNFDVQGRLMNIKDRNDNTITLGYDAENKLTQIIDPNGKQNALLYGDNKKVSQLVLFDGRKATFTYDKNNNLVLNTDIVGAAINYTYDDASYMTSYTTPHRGKVSFDYAVENEGYELKSITDALGNKRTYRTSSGHTTIEVTDSRKNTVKYRNNYDGYTESISSASGNAVTFVYDNLGNRREIMDNQGNKNSFVYNSSGNITEMTDPAKNKFSFVYDDKDNLKETQDAKGNVYSFVYDDKSNLKDMHDPDDQVTSFDYNAYGQVKKITDAKGGVIEFDIDAQGILKKMIDAGGKITQYIPDASGRVATLIDPKGETFSYEYDGLDRARKITYPDKSITEYLYNCCNLQEIRDKNGVLSFTYDAIGRMTEFTNYDNMTIGYAYDTEDNLTELTYPDGKKVKYAYDTDNRMTKVTDWMGNVTEYNYDVRGNLSFSSSPGLLSIYKYDALNRMTELINYNSKTLKITSGFDFKLDELGNRSDITRYMPINLPRFNTESASYTYNAANQLLTVSGKGVRYDDNGNMAELPTKLETPVTFVYDYDNQLTQYTSGRDNLSFKYDALGNRIQKLQNKIPAKYIVDPNRRLPGVIAETYLTGEINAYYVYGIGLISKIVGDKAYFYQYDGLGSTVAMTDKEGEVVNKYAYGDFGELATNSTETIPNPYKYVGKYGVMTDTNDLLYMRARYYVPSIGRFINKDPIGLAGGMNMYAYVGGNSVNWVDPGGLKKWAPDWIQRLILSYGNYGGPANTDPNFQKQPIDSMDEIFMEHDRGWANDQCGLANRNMFSNLVSLPVNPYRWKRKPRNILWAIYSIPYSILAVSYAFWF